VLIPIGDDNKGVTGPAYVTTGLVAANVLIFIFLQGAGSNTAFTYGWSAVPYEITTGEDLRQAVQIVVGGRPETIPQAPGPPLIYLTLLSSMFMHGGIVHLLGNMLYLWIFGDNVEHRFGWRAFLVFYLMSGLAASTAQILLDPQSVIPSLGASGAISGVLGAYMVLFPRNRVYAVFFFWIVTIPALVAIGLWILLQVFSGWGTIVAGSQAGGGVAYGAHIGGFVAGIVMATILRFVIKEEPDHKYSHVARSDGSRRYW
jgi:membrane associated rhomboid family serine protease